MYFGGEKMNSLQAAKGAVRAAEMITFAGKAVRTVNTVTAIAKVAAVAFCAGGIIKIVISSRR